MSINAVSNNLSGLGIQNLNLNSLYGNIGNIGSIESHTFSEYLNKSIEAINNQNSDKSVVNITTVGMPAQLQYELFNNGLSEVGNKFENLINTIDNKVENNQEMSVGQDNAGNIGEKNSYDAKDLNKDGEVSASEMLRYFANSFGNFVQNQTENGFLQGSSLKNFMQQQGLKAYEKILPIAETALSML